MQTSNMIDYLLLTILIIPAIALAAKSTSGNNTGYFLLYIWLAGACIYGFLGLPHFIFGLSIFVFVAFIFRKKLEMKKWWSRSTNKTRN